MNTVFIVTRNEANEGGWVVFVGDSKEKALSFMNDNPLHSRIEYYDVEELEVK